MSNDLTVNDISLCDWQEEEKRGIGKIPRTGYFRIEKEFLNKYNNIELDSISAVYRCDNGLGVFFKFKWNKDTVLIENIKTCKN